MATLQAVARPPAPARPRIGANQFECSVCINIFSNHLKSTCTSCTFSNCLQCHKEYLLTTSNEPHCMSCRTVIPYCNFIEKFGTSWVFSKYKKHRENILWNKENSLLPQTVHKYSVDKKIVVLRAEIKELNLEIRNKKIAIWGLNNPVPTQGAGGENKPTKFNYTYRCPVTDCKGFINKENSCDICEALICLDCYSEVNKAHKDHHECDQQLVDTFNEIKREAKPCPSCGFFISKVSGCDQMFCVSCGTPFSWRTGKIEQGIIHNPHAHTYFQNNPEAQQNYLNGIHRAAGGDGCRTPIPTIQSFKKQFIDRMEFITKVHTGTSEFRQYQRTRVERFLNSEYDENNDLRLKFIHKEINEKKFKELVHARHKKLNYFKEIARIFMSTYETFETLLWAIVDLQPTEATEFTVKKRTEILNAIDFIGTFRENVNNELIKLSQSFHYMSIISITSDYKCPYTMRF
jgi:hypothetical protein